MADAQDNRDLPETRSASDDCIVLLEELIRSNRELADENERLRTEHEKASKAQTEVLKRIEQRLNEKEREGREAIPRGGHRYRKRARRTVTAVPAACRRSLRKIYKVLCGKENFNGFHLDEVVSSENNVQIIERVISQALHQHGGQERCPWTRDTMKAALERYFLSLYGSQRLKNGAKYEAFKRRTRKNGRQREKLTRRTASLEFMNWDNHKKGKAAEVLTLEAMSSEESTYEEDENHNRKLTHYSVRRLSWESRKLKVIKKKLDKAYGKRLTKRAKERVVKRVDATEPSDREAPDSMPEWALK